MKSSLATRIAFIILCSSCFLFTLLVQDLTNWAQREAKLSSVSWTEEAKTNVKDDEPKESFVYRDEEAGKKLRVFKPFSVLSNKVIDNLSESIYRDELWRDSSKLLNLFNLSYLIEPNQRVKCVERDEDEDGRVNLLIVVNSRWTNFERRRRLRSNWLNRSNIQKQICAKFNAINPSSQVVGSVEFMFALGKPSNKSANDKTLSELLSNEAKRYADLLVINLHDHYRSMSLKHLSIFKWIQGPDFGVKRSSVARGDKEVNRELMVLKCDDDADINLSDLLELYAIKRKMWSLERDGQWIMCARFPQNTLVLRNRQHKWTLTPAEYPFDTFPAYCSGLAYLAPMGLLKRLLGLAHVLLRNNSLSSGSSQFKSPLWIDDVFITGILMASLADKPKVVHLNAHFCYTRAQQSRRLKLNATCMVSELANYKH